MRLSSAIGTKRRQWWTLSVDGFDFKHMQQLNELWRMARLYIRAGKLELAEQLYLDTIEHLSKHNGNAGTDLAICLFKLAELYSDEGKYPEARRCYGQAARLWTDAHPEDSLNHVIDTMVMINLQEVAGLDSSPSEEAEGAA